MRFSRKRHGLVEAKLDPVEAGVLTSVVGDLLDLLGEHDDTEQDPLAAMVGMPTGPVERPADPALARLLPDAYGDDDDAAADFRRYTEADLRSGKRSNAAAVLAALAPYAETGGRVLLDREQQDAWLGCLNDLRLVLGTRLEVTEETDFDPDSDDPRQQALLVYGWLGWLQESLLDKMVTGAR